MPDRRYLNFQVYYQPGASQPTLCVDDGTSGLRLAGVSTLPNATLGPRFTVSRSDVARLALGYCAEEVERERERLDKQRRDAEEYERRRREAPDA